MSTEHRHPSHGSIRLSRVQGDADLFMSPVRAHSFVELLISEGETGDRASGGSGKVRARKGIIKVRMSAAQFADMITGFNADEVPCTINWRVGEGYIDAPPHQIDPLDAEAAHGAKQVFAESVAYIDKAIAAIRSKAGEATSGPKRKAMETIAGHLETAKSRLAHDAPHFAKVLTEHAESLRSKVRADLVATAELMLKHLGTEALRERAARILPTLDDKEAP